MRCPGTQMQQRRMVTTSFFFLLVLSLFVTPLYCLSFALVTHFRSTTISTTVAITNVRKKMIEVTMM